MASKKTETGIVDFPVQKATKKPRIAFGSTLREYRLKAHLEQEQVKHETERIESTFLEPACGNGNFLAEILRRGTVKSYAQIQQRHL